MILKLPQGFDTPIGETAVALSAGQRQRIGLARALYKDPFLLVLDEPNSNLDAEGEAALGKAMRAVRQRGGIVVVMAHRPSALAEVDQVLFIRDGVQSMFGPRDEILKRVVSNPEVCRPLRRDHGGSEPMSDANGAEIERHPRCRMRTRRRGASNAG